MAGRFPRSFAWIIAGVVLLASFAALIYTAGAWTGIYTYSVGITADENVSWTVTAPGSAGSPWPVWQKSDNRLVVEPVDMGLAEPPGLPLPGQPVTHGYVYNISGHGDGTVWFRITESSFDLGLPPGACTDCTPGGPSYGAYGDTARVARESTNASSVIVFSGTMSETHTRADEQVLCPGPTFSGALSEGWNNLSMVLTMCTTSASAVPISSLSIPFLLVGLLCMYVGVDRGRKFRWEK